MEIINVNNVKIYNLSHGRSVPEWLSESKRRKLLKKEPSLRRNIQLIQDFEMPQVCDNIRLSNDGQYIFVTGVYKPRVRCYDTSNLSLKFERCFDSEVVKFDILSDDYTKLVFLFCDRYVEFHSQAGRYFRIRIPKFGRDLAYLKPTCDLFFVGNTPDILRLNLEKGQFLSPYQGESSCFNVCKINPYHQLIVCGSADGRVEAWDYRDRSRVGVLDCALDTLSFDKEGIPSITSMAFKDGLNLAVGTAKGLVLLYDLRSSKPYYIKDHMYCLPILDLDFNSELDLVLSMDSKILKLWNREDGKPYTAIQTNADLKDLCLVPDTGMFFLANEDKKIQTYFIPSLGPAPKWCSFLDGIVEELEENTEDAIYDDYKFVTIKDLEEFGLVHLIGTNLLRAYMHGFFIDNKLYNKAKAASDPFAYEEYKKKKVKEKLDEQRSDRVKIQNNLPKINKELAQRLMESQNEENQKLSKMSTNLLKDDRFKALFENPDFQIEKN